MRYEQIVFFNDTEDDSYLCNDLYDENGADAVIDYMSQWHFPGEHEVSDDPGYGTSDVTYEDDQGYILSRNERLGYWALAYDTEHDA